MTNTCGKAHYDHELWAELREFAEYELAVTGDYGEMLIAAVEELDITPGSLHPRVEDIGEDSFLLEVLGNAPELICMDPRHPLVLSRISRGVSTLRGTPLADYPGTLRFMTATTLVEFGRVLHRTSITKDVVLGEENLPKDKLWFIESLLQLPIPELWRYLEGVRETAAPSYIQALIQDEQVEVDLENPLSELLKRYLGASENLAYFVCQVAESRERNGADITVSDIHYVLSDMDTPDSQELLQQMAEGMLD